MSPALDAHTSQGAKLILTRDEFYEQLEASKENISDCDHALVFLRILNLGIYNTLYGVDQGDKLLSFVVDSLQQNHSVKLFARYSVDSFMFLVPNQEVSFVVDELNTELPTYGTINGLVAKAGYVMQHYRFSAPEALERAHFACASIHHEPDTFCQFFAGDVELAYDKRVYVVEHLDDAIANHEIQVYLQPIVRLISGRICEAECLARWQSSKYGFLRPDEFIPELERQQLIHKLDLEIINLACKNWVEAHAQGIDLPFGINLSRLDFDLCDIFDLVDALRRQHGVPIDQMHVEVTESAASSSEKVVRDGVQRFADAGYEIYLDDYGSGYSTLNVLRAYPLKVVKLDMSLVRDIEYDERSRVIVGDTISMIKRLGFQALCEGIETQEQLDLLRAVGCEKGQGYYFSKPVPATELLEHLRQNPDSFEAGDMREFLDLVGMVDPVMGTSAALQGVEAAHFLGHEPISIIEISPVQPPNLLMANASFQRYLSHFGCVDIGAFTSFTESEAPDANVIAATTCERAKETGKPQSFGFTINNEFYSIEVTHIASTDHSDAFMHRITAVDIGSSITNGVLLRGALNVVDRMVFWKDVECRFVGANAAFLQYYGFESVDAILGKTVEDMGWNVGDEPLRSERYEILQGKSVHRQRGCCVCRDELRRIEFSKEPLYSNNAVVGLVGYFEDLGPADDAEKAAFEALVNSVTESPIDI